MAATTSKIKLYTNHMSPWAHRANIALAELNAQLGVAFEEEIVDITKPRTPEYLQINPRGLVPALSYNGEIITESAIIATFLSDVYTSSSLLPTSTAPDGPLTRAKVAFFVDTYLTKVTPAFMKVNGAKSDEERTKILAEFVDVTAKEIEPLLASAAPFFGGSSTLTLAEVLTAPFILRQYTLIKHGMLPANLADDLAAKAPQYDKWAQRVITHPSVVGPFEDAEEAWVGFMKQKASQAKPGA